jgi:hypothetical protein
VTISDTGGLDNGPAFTLADSEEAIEGETSTPAVAGNTITLRQEGCFEEDSVLGSPRCSSARRPARDHAYGRAKGRPPGRTDAGGGGQVGADAGHPDSGSGAGTTSAA